MKQILLLLLIALALSTPQAISAEVDSRLAFVSRPIRDFSSIQIGNFEQINQGLLRGAAPSDEDVRELASHGVKTIVDLRMSGPASAREARLAKELGLKYVHVPLGFSKPSSAKLKQVLETLVDREKQPVFLHCRQGADRTGMLVGIYRMLVDDWKFEDVYNEMRHHHFKPWLVGMRKTVEDCRHSNELHGVVVMSAREPDSAEALPKVAEVSQ